MFYSSGLSFNSARDPYFRSSFSFILKNIIPGYVPPDCKRLKTTLLQKERARIEDLLKPIKSMWRKAGVTIVSDGWSDIRQRSLVNILAVNECGPIFLQAINNEDEVNTKEYIAEKLIAVIEDVGPENVVQVITDNDPVCRAAGLLIEEKYDHIQWMPCIAHTLSLALKDVFSPNNTGDVAFKDSHWISEVVEDAIMIKNFIINHTMISSILSEFSKLKILAIANTRFASDLVMLKRFRLIKQSLIMLVISDKWWPVYCNDNMEQAQLVKYKLTDNSWWKQVDYILSFTEPIYSMMRVTDTEEPRLHLINEMWNTMVEKVKAAIYKHESREPEEESAFYSVVHGILEDWWSRSKTPLQCLAHSLNPRYYSDSWINQAANRLPPHRDAEISQVRNNCWRKMFFTTDNLRTVKSEYGEFALLGTKHFSLNSRPDRDKLDPKMWWATHGTSAQAVQSLAFKLLSQPVSSSCCQRNWRTYDSIRDIVRDKLRPKWADDLVFVHNNLRLLSRRSEEYHTDREARYWDVGDDKFKSLGGAGILESANLSLDEPEFELAMIENIV
ncbi:uncharacterized protein LOC127773117 isoform X4 [Oryza glaberrima]|nr:uncharacterized protein LOC127773117 isoform X4 [Oryza glaberrima]